MKEGGEILMEREGRGERGGGDEEGSWGFLLKVSVHTNGRRSIARVDEGFYKEFSLLSSY
jgi:hypothetical protein